MKLRLHGDPPLIPIDWLMVSFDYIALLKGVLIGKAFWEKNVATYSKNLKHKCIRWLKKNVKGLNILITKNVRVD